MTIHFMHDCKPACGSKAKKAMLGMTEHVPDVDCKNCMRTSIFQHARRMHLAEQACKDHFQRVEEAREKLRDALARLHGVYNKENAYAKRYSILDDPWVSEEVFDALALVMELYDKALEAQGGEP